MTVQGCPRSPACAFIPDHTDALHAASRLALGFIHANVRPQFNLVDVRRGVTDRPLRRAAIQGTRLRRLDRPRQRLIKVASPRCRLCRATSLSCSKSAIRFETRCMSERSTWFLRSASRSSGRSASSYAFIVFESPDFFSSRRQRKLAITREYACSICRYGKRQFMLF